MNRLLVLSVLAAGAGLCTGAALADPPAGYRLVFDDEFSGTALDAAQWKVGDRWGNRNLSGNGEQQFYAGMAGDGCNPVTVGLGALDITAAPASATGCAGQAGGRSYVSGEISTFGKAQWTYGYFELRARLPDGAGMWPAFWLLPADGRWPPEIDIVEKVDDSHTVVQTTHGDGGMNGTGYDGIDPADGFHTYGLEWTASRIVYTVDGVRTADKANVCDQPMYLLLNLAVGGWWPGNPAGERGDLVVDYVRVYSTDTSLKELALTGESPVDWSPTSMPAVTVAAQAQLQQLYANAGPTSDGSGSAVPSPPLSTGTTAATAGILSAGASASVPTGTTPAAAGGASPTTASIGSGTGTSGITAAGSTAAVAGTGSPDTTAAMPAGPAPTQTVATATPAATDTATTGPGSAAAGSRTGSTIRTVTGAAPVSTAVTADTGSGRTAADAASTASDSGVSIAQATAALADLRQWVLENASLVEQWLGLRQARKPTGGSR